MTTEAKTYIGTKIVKAQPMGYHEFRELMARDMIVQSGNDLKKMIEMGGYMVEYLGAGRPNVKGFDNYVSWSPKDTFEESHKPTVGMSFGMALEAMTLGKSVARRGWNGNNMFIFLIQGSNDIAKLHGYGFGELLGEPTFSDAIFMKTSDNKLVPWTVSQTDVMSKDWEIV